MAKTLICPNCGKADMDPEHVWENSLKIKCSRCGEWGDTKEWKTVSQLHDEITLLRGLLKSEQEDCHLQRANKNAEWERAERYKAALERIGRQVVADRSIAGEMKRDARKALGLPASDMVQVTV